MSVCIVHRDGWAVTDSRANHWNTGILPKQAIKAFHSQGCLVTVTGTSVLNQKLKKIAETQTMLDLPGAISDFMYDVKEGNSGSVLMVNGQRELILFDAVGHASLLTEQDYWAIGCAADRVLGYLDAVSQDNTVSIEVKHAEMAIKRAAKFDSGIDDRTQVFLLRG